MSKTGKYQTAAKADRDNLHSPPTHWSEDKIPPLVSINIKQKQHSNKIQIQSLSQSEVRSIYTIDREPTENRTIEIFHNEFLNIRDDRNHRFDPKQTIATERIHSQQQVSPPKKIYETPQPVHPNILPEYEDDLEFDIKNCHAVKLFNQLVQQPSMHSNYQGQQKYQYEWLKSKTPSELIFSVVNNEDRMRLYVHYLLNQIYLNEKAKLVNQLHQMNVAEYIPNLKEVYSGIICLLSKLTIKQKTNAQATQKKSSNPTAPSPKELAPEVSIFENGLSIDIDPKMNALKRKNNEKIRQLRQLIVQQDKTLLSTRKLYEQIIQNYAVTIQNINRRAQSAEFENHPPFKQSIVQLQIDEEDTYVRTKNHTFGMKASLEHNQQPIA